MAVSYPYFDLRDNFYGQWENYPLREIERHDTILGASDLVIVLGIRRERDAREGRKYCRFRLDYDEI